MNDMKKTLLKVALSNLSKDPENQLKLFQHTSVIPDELALDFENAYSCSKDENFILSQSEVRQTLSEIDQLLDLMSSKKYKMLNPDIWSEKALLEKEEWSIIREKSESILSIIDWNKKW